MAEHGTRKTPTEDHQLDHAREQLFLTRHKTASVRRQLADLYGHNEDTAPPGGETDSRLPLTPTGEKPDPPAPGTETGRLAAVLRRLTAARRELARLHNKMADYQETEGYNRDAADRRAVAVYELTAAAYDQATADELDQLNTDRTGSG